MKQKIFLILVVGFLITVPALAAHANPFHVSLGAVDSTLGSIIMPFGTTNVATTITPGGGLTLSVDVEIRSLGKIVAYLYKLNVSGASVIVSGWGLSSAATTLFAGPLPGHSLGWVGGPSSGSPFLVNPTLGAPLFFLFSSFTGGELIVYATSELLPEEQVSPPPPPPFQLAEFYFEFGTGSSSVLGPTIGPHADGGGTGLGDNTHYVPEASSLLLLTFGLFSGGVLRFRINHNFSGKRK